MSFCGCWSFGITTVGGVGGGGVGAEAQHNVAGWGGGLRNQSGYGCRKADWVVHRKYAKSTVNECGNTWCKRRQGATGCSHLKMGDSETFVAYGTRARTLRTMINFDCETVSEFNLAEALTFGLTPELKMKAHNFQLLLVSPFKIYPDEFPSSPRLQRLLKLTRQGMYTVQSLNASSLTSFTMGNTYVVSGSEINLISEEAAASANLPRQPLPRPMRISLALKEGKSTPL
ncbi:hypothetical protein VP01_3608g1, partial [Puccinia sorghi]